jgi:Protein of unknown function (DUF2550)
MLIALLVVLGVDLIIVIAFAVLVLGRRRWLKRQPGEYAGAIRMSHGDFEGLSAKWKRGSGRWVRDVLVWSKAPLMLQNELLPVDRFVGQRRATQGEVKHLGDSCVVIEFASNGTQIEVASRAEHHSLVSGPFPMLERS